jgi:DNA-binding MarR family transcriptional regulator
VAAFEALAIELTPPTTVREVAATIGKSEATASRHVADLEACGLVAKERHEQSKAVTLTLTGRLLARSLRLKEGDE